MQSFRGGCAAAFLLFIVALASPANAAGTLIKTQAACTSSQGYCLQFVSGGPLTIREFSMAFPAAGTALVRFHGSLLCANASTGGRQVADLQTQIVTTAGAAPSLAGPGGLRHAVVLRKADLPGSSTSDTFSLASHRLVNIDRAGSRTFFFRVAVLRMDPNITCYVYNAAFSVEFVPTAGPAKLASSGPCAGYCVTFTPTGAIPVVRSLKFVAPADGKARVMLNGVLYCASSSSAEPLITLDSQIVASATAAPVFTGPGGLRFWFGKLDLQESDTVNLASERTVNVAKGSTTNFYFKVARSRMDAGAQCWIYNAALTVLFVPTASNEVLATQAPCVDPNEYCKYFNGNYPSIPLIQKFTFNAPARGTALVSFSASMLCENGLRDATTVIDLVSQIVTSAGQSPSATASGGLRHAVRLKPPVGDWASTDPFSLAAARVIVLPAGPITFYFKIGKLKIENDYNGQCTVYNGAFSVDFVRS